MQKEKLMFFLLIVTLLLSGSCKDDEMKFAKSRDVTFEATGNFSGTMEVTYTTSNGGATSESISALPWSKAITYESTVSGLAVTLGGGGGTPGQTLLLKVKAGNKVVSETPGVANSSGVIAIASPTYIF